MQATAASGTRNQPVPAAAKAFRMNPTAATAIATPSMPGSPRLQPLPQHLLVDDVLAVGLAVEDRKDVLHRDDAHAVDRLSGDAGDVGGGDEVGQGQQRVVVW